MDKRVAETYAKDSKATNKNALSDPYVKAFRWASDRIGDEGIVAFVSNNSFVESLAFDGMRQHIEKDFSIRCMYSTLAATYARTRSFPARRTTCLEFRLA